MCSSDDMRGKCVAAVCDVALSTKGLDRRLKTRDRWGAFTNRCYVCPSLMRVQTKAARTFDFTAALQVEFSQLLGPTRKGRIAYGRTVGEAAVSSTMINNITRNENTCN